MRCSDHCPPESSGAMAAVAVVALTAVGSVLGAVLNSIAVIVLGLLCAACIAGSALFVHLLRGNPRAGLYDGEDVAELMARQSRQLPARSAAAIGTGHRDAVITSMIVRNPDGEYR